MKCKLCKDEGWICEEHPDKPFGHDDCCGWGDPCPDCNDGGETGGDFYDLRTDEGIAMFERDVLGETTH